MDIWISGLPITVALAAVIVIAYLFCRRNAGAGSEELVEDKSE
jgi:hypothetical protein